jgi:subtilisin-like proprotein convertase family protein
MVRNHHLSIRSFLLARWTNALFLLVALLTQATAQVVSTYDASGTFVVPAGVTQVTVECWGGGGRGGTRTNNGPGGGGGGGAYARSVLTVSPGTYTVTVGAGSSSASPGGDSWFGSATTILAKGGGSVSNNNPAGAPGGLASQCIGTVTFSGGNGASGSGSGGTSVSGGGGSSAGTAAAGNNGSGSTGATAPTGGGNGGNGRTSGQGQGDGSNGAAPGAGGGGGKRTSSGTRDGGSGANGRVVISFEANGICMGQLPGNTIPDQGCVTIGVNTSGLPTTLGTAPGNARLYSVELIVDHTYNADLDITLTSPGGATRNLVLDEGGNGDDMGDPNNCPTAVLLLIDGGTATFPNNSNLTGSYAPEQTLAGFTGNPNGRWVLSVCDDANMDEGSVRLVRLNFCSVPQITASSSNSPVCASGTLNLSVTATGTLPLTYAWTGTGTYSPGASSATPSVTGPATGNYNIAVSNLCGSTNTNVPVTVTPVPSTAAAGGDQSTCAVDAVTLAANTPAVGTGAWSIVSGPSTNLSQFSNTASPTSTFLGDGGPGTYTLRWSISNGSCPASTDDVVITVNACAYYSRGSGNVGDAIWSLTPSGTAGAATWNASTNMVVQNGNTITTTADLQVGSITVDNGGTLVLGGFNLTANGAMVDVNGTLTANDNSTLTLAGSGAKTLDLASATSFWNLTCNAPDGTTLTGNATIRNTLLLPDGDFDCTGNPVTLASNATRTGRLGPVGATASYTGQLVVNRHIPAGATNWRMFGSSVAGRTVNDLKDDFYTAGFPGSHSPNFASPVGSGILWPSIRWYDETNTGAGINDGLSGATGTSQALTPGQGFAAWCGTGLTTTTAFNVDVTGTPNIATTPITLPMSYTNTGVPATDGWNMVSNPLPSPIAFDQISRGADVADYVTYFNPANGNLATWDISEGLGTNGGSNIIQSSQGFWLKATGSAVTTTVDEQDKVEGNTGGFFGGAEVQTANLVRLRVESNINQYSDETVVVFSSGQPAITSQDVPKFIFAHPDAPQIASMGDGGEMIAINAFGPFTTDISIPITVDVAVNGNYTIVATGLSNIGLSCVRLEDLATNTSTALVEGTEYTFTALATDDVNEPRFLLHATAPLQLTATDATCHGMDDGSASLQVTSGPVDVIWTDAEGADILEQNGVMPGTSDLVALPAGEYSIRVVGDAACSTRSTVFTIEEPAALEAETITLPSSCPDTEDGRIDLTVLGGEAPYTFQWSNEATTEDLDVAAGTYTVLITDANGCTFAPQEYVVGAGEGPDAGISVENTVVQVGDEILFAPNTYEGVSNTWDFGDGTTSTDLEAIHTYDVPGTYIVTLTVDNGDCISTATLEVAVETTTGITTDVGRNLNAWVSGDLIVVDHDFGGQDPVLIRVFNSGGQLAMEKKVAQAPARITLPANELATGVWLVRVSSGAVYRTFALPIVH